MKQPLNIEVNTYTVAFQAWLEGANKILQDHMTANYPTNPREHLTASFGTRFVKVWRTNDAGQDVSIHAFIDRSNGDVLKPASCNAPAKHARGNIFDANNGLKDMGPYGPAYLQRGR
jgi:hypothetical protein